MSNSGSKGNSGNTNGGTETSFTKTPQAKDDSLGTLQSGTLNYINTVYYLDVMANDLAGKAKSLWSVDDGNNDSGAMSGYEAGDLLTQDLPGATGVAANRSQFGAAIWVTPDGKVAYDTSTIDAPTAADLTGLALGETMTDSFIYAIRMANGTLSWARASVTLTGVNDTPTVEAVSVDAVEDGASVTGSFLGDDVDSDDDINSLIYSIIGGPDTGTLSNNGDGTFSYDPGKNFQSLSEGQTADFELTYTATDKHGAVSDPASLKITVTGVNDDPTLAAGAMAAVEDGPAVTLDLSALGDDVDGENDGSNLIYSVTGDPAEGSAAISGTTLTFDTEGGFQDLGLGLTRDVVVEVTATDKRGGTATNNVTVTVTGMNDDPTLAAGALAASEEGPAVSLDLSTLADDIDNDDDSGSLTYALLDDAPAGSATLTGSVLSFDPLLDVFTDKGKGFSPKPFDPLAAGQTTSFDLAVQVTDKHGATADSVVTVTVTGVNDAPKLQSASVAATEDGQAVTLDLSLRGSDIDSDDDGSTLAYSISGAPAKGSASISGTTFSFDPGSEFQYLAKGEVEDVAVQVTATDKHGASATNTVNVSVLGVNDGPTLAAGTLAASEDGPTVTLDLATLGDDLDSDDDGSTLAYSITGYTGATSSSTTTSSSSTSSSESKSSSSSSSSSHRS
ncbi:MAG: tandem-95 repeat protein, partial [Gammaproteobacteria bacterium]|nr:tandem-95 repeat protein [Gammaproteobacteria bacterium]